MKTLYIECAMGASGDMLLAALSSLLLDPGSFVDELNALGIPGVRAKRERAFRCGIAGSRMEVTVNGEAEESADWACEHGCDHDHDHSHDHDHDHHHDHDHDHDHGHHHSHDHDHDHDHDHHHSRDHDHAHDHSHDHDRGDGRHCATREGIFALIDALPVSAGVGENAKRVYSVIADAESEAHGVPVGMAHFHEVGAMDAVADIVGVCLLMERLGPERVVVSPVNVGGGFVRCSHGILPVPAPATANILKGVPIFSGEIRAELCTPTGAALLKHFAGEFGNMPRMAVEKIGVGLGKKEFAAANCLRAFLGESEDREGPGERIRELACNLDDMTGEDVAFAAEKLLEEGALDVFSQPAQMKKGRPGVILTCLCKEEEQEKFARLMLLHTTTFGVRAKICERYALARGWETQTTRFGEIRVKAGTGFGVSREKPEYEDVKAAAVKAGVPLSEIRKEL